ncbi:MAG: MATE family efflux transporter [Adlercreutzia equolifaciens]
MFVNLFVGLSIGANVVVAMHVGAGEFHSIKKSVHTAMALSLIAGVALGAAGLALAPCAGRHRHARRLLADALTYVRLYFCAIPFLTIYNFGSALLRAHGDAKRPLYALAAAVVVNFVLDLAFVRLFGWGTAGIGVATVIAAALSAVIVVAFLMREEGPFRLHLRELRISGPELAGILRIGVPAGVQGAVFSLSNTVVQAAINGFGSAAIAGSAATLNFEYYTYFFVNAFGQTAVTFTGQNFAAKNADRCRAIFRWCMLFGFASSLILGVTFTALGTRALGLFTTDAAAPASASCACGSWSCPTA